MCSCGNTKSCISKTITSGRKKLVTVTTVTSTFCTKSDTYVGDFEQYALFLHDLRLNSCTVQQNCVTLKVMSINLSKSKNVILKRFIRWNTRCCKYKRKVYQVKVDDKTKSLEAVNTNSLICFYSLTRLHSFLLRTFVLLVEWGVLVWKGVEV